MSKTLAAAAAAAYDLCFMDFEKKGGKTTLAIMFMLTVLRCGSDAGGVSGPIRCMRWTPDGTALAVAWQNGGLSLWSVYGALLLCTLGGDYR